MDIKTHSCAQKGKSISESIKFPTLLEAIERVVELSKDSKMSNDFLQNAVRQSRHRLRAPLPLQNKV